MDTKVETTVNIYDLNLMENITMKCRRFGQQADKIPISQFGGQSFKGLFWKLCSKREKYGKKPAKLSQTRILNMRMTYGVWWNE